ALLGDLDRPRIAARLVAAAAEDLDLLAELRLVDSEVVPDVGMLRHDAQQLLLAAAADQDGWTSHRLRLAPSLVDARWLAGERGLLLGEQPLHQLAGFLERLEALADGRERRAVRLVLGGEPAAAEPDDHAAVRDLVDGRRLLGEHGGIAEER